MWLLAAPAKWVTSSRRLQATLRDSNHGQPALAPLAAPGLLCVLMILATLIAPVTPAPKTL